MCPGQALGQPVDRHRHVADFIGRDPHALVWQHPSAHVQKGTLEFFHRLDNAPGHDDAQGNAQNHNDPRHAPRIHGELRPEGLHLGGPCAEGGILGGRQSREPRFHALRVNLKLGTVVGVAFRLHGDYGVVVAAEIRQQPHDFSVEQHQGVDLGTQRVNVRLSGWRPGAFQ